MPRVKKSNSLKAKNKSISLRKIDTERLNDLGKIFSLHQETRLSRLIQKIIEETHRLHCK